MAVSDSTLFHSSNFRPAIEAAAEFYDRKKAESILRTDDEVTRLIRAITNVLERDDLTHPQRRELAEQLSTRHFDFSVLL